MLQDNVKDLSVVHLNVLLNLLKTRSTSLSAREMGISQSTISYHLQKLRGIFQDELFLRTGRGLQPTERCQRIGILAQDILLRIEEDLVHAGKFQPEAVERELSIVADDTSCCWFATLFADMAQKMPRATLCGRPWHLKSFSDIAEGSVQFGVHVMQPTNRGVYQVDITPCYRVFVVRKNHPIASKGFVELEDLAEYPVILNDLAGMNSFGHSLIERTLAEENLNANLVSKISHIGTIFDALATTNAISYTSALTLPADLSEHVLLRAPNRFLDVKGNYKLYFCRHKYGSAETDWLVSFLTDSFRRFADERYSRSCLAGLLY